MFEELLGGDSIKTEEIYEISYPEEDPLALDNKNVEEVSYMGEDILCRQICNILSGHVSELEKI